MHGLIAQIDHQEECSQGGIVPQFVAITAWLVSVHGLWLQAEYRQHHARLRLTQCKSNVPLHHFDAGTNDGPYVMMGFCIALARISVTFQTWWLGGKGVCHIATLRPRYLATIRPYHLTTLPPYDLTTLRPYDLTTLPPYHLTTLPPYNLTTLPPHHLTTLPPYHAGTCGVRLLSTMCDRKTALCDLGTSTCACHDG